jgi:hypothetical protein
MHTITAHDKITCSSRYALNVDAFDIINTVSSSFRLNPNSTITTDTPKGILGGSCAKVSGDWEASLADHTDQILGLFNGNSEGNAFENSPAIASGVLPIFMNGGAFTLYVFETHAHESAFGSILANYDVGDKLYCSAFGLLTTELPSAHSTPGSDVAVAICSKVPTSSDLSLGIKLLV